MHSNHNRLAIVFVFIGYLVHVGAIPVTDSLPDEPGSLHQQQLKCEGGQELDYTGTDTDGDGIKVNYECGGNRMSRQLSCQSGFKAYSKRDVVACDPSNALFRGANTDPNKMDKAVIVWYCMKKTGTPCELSQRG